MHDSDVVGDSSCTNVKHPYAVEILVDVATGVDDIYGDTNTVSPGHLSISSLGDDVPDHSSRSPANQARSVSVDVSLNSSDDDDVSTSALGKSQTNKPSHSVPMEAGPSSQTRSSWSMVAKQPSGSDTTPLFSQALRTTVQFLILGPIVVGERFLGTFRECPLMVFLFTLKRMSCVGIMFSNGVLLMKKCCRSKQLGVWRLWNRSIMLV